MSEQDGGLVRYMPHTSAVSVRGPKEYAGMHEHPEGPWVPYDQAAARIAALDKELEGAKAIIKGFRMKVNGDVAETCACRFNEKGDPLAECGHHEAERQAREAAEQRAREAEKDAERYRWLRDRPSVIGWDWWPTFYSTDVNITPEFMDAAVDKEMKDDSEASWAAVDAPIDAAKGDAG